MADLDTRSQRASSVGLFKPYVLALPFPDGAIGPGDRQHSLWDYSGIMAQTLALACGLVSVVFSGSGPSVAWSGSGPEITFSAEGCD